MTKILTRDVFTPTRPAHKTFVERSSKINDYLVDALMTPGKQIVVYGHSGSGKTTLILNKLEQTYERVVITRCMETMTYENIITDAFDQLDKYYIDESTITKGKKINPTFNISYKEIKAAFSIFEYNDSNSEKTKRLIPPQLTLQRLAKFFGEIDCCWVLEDFHKVKTSDKAKVSQAMKVFMDTSWEYPELKIIALGAVNTARQVVEYDKEMNNRVSEIYVPLMSENELKQIIEVGEQLLNVKFDKDVKNNIVSISCGLPSICHQLCLNICYNRRIYETYSTKVFNREIDTAVITIKDYQTAIEKFIEEKSDTFKSEFDKAIKTESTRKVNKPRIILENIIGLKQTSFYLDDVIQLINRSEYGITENEVKEYMSQFITHIRGEILIYDSNSNTYSFNNVFLKAYCKLKFQSDESSQSDSRKKEKAIISRLLKLIEQDASRSLFEIYYDNNFKFIEEADL